MLRWGILGTSFISDTMAEAIKLSEGSVLSAVAGRDRGRTEAFAARHGIASVASDYDALVAHPEVDIVYIGLPNHLHHIYAIKAAAHGKHVLTEKSLSVDMEKTEEMLASVEKAGVFFAEGLMYRAHPVISRFARVIREGQIGEVRMISTFYAASIAEFVNPGGHGTLYNLGCYPVSLLQLLMATAFGAESFRAFEISGFGLRGMNDGNISDANAVVRFENGVLATLAASDTHGMAYGFTVTGTHQSIRFRTNPWLPGTGNSVIELVNSDSGMIAESIVVNSEGDGFLCQVQMIEKAIAEGRTEAIAPSPSREDSRDIMAFLTRWEAACR